MKYFYLILVFILFIPFNLISQFEVKELNDSILKPKTIDFMNVNEGYGRGRELIKYLDSNLIKNIVYDSTYHIDNPERPLIVNLIDRPLVYIGIFTAFWDENSFRLIDNSRNIPISHIVYQADHCGEPTSTLLVKEFLLNNAYKFFDISLSFWEECDGPGVDLSTESIKILLLYKNKKYFIWTINTDHDYEKSIFSKKTGQIIGMAEKNYSRSVKLLNNKLYITKWVEENEEVHNKNSDKEFIYKFEFPNFVRVNH